MLRPKQYTKKLLHGDTLIEVTFAIGIFCLVTITSMSLMNRSLNGAQTSIESIMARNAIDSQAEKIRFYYDSVVAQRAQQGTDSSNYDSTYNDTWADIVDHMNLSDQNTATFLNSYAGAPCNELIQKIRDKQIKVFVITTNNQYSETINTTSTYPKIDGGSTFGYNPQGIWVVPVSSAKNVSEISDAAYYDFYIQTCWNAPGESSSTTLSTVFRLYNTETTVSHAAAGNATNPNNDQESNNQNTQLPLIEGDDPVSSSSSSSGSGTVSAPQSSIELYKFVKGVWPFSKDRWEKINVSLPKVSRNKLTVTYTMSSNIPSNNTQIKIISNGKEETTTVNYLPIELFDGVIGKVCKKLKLDITATITNDEVQGFSNFNSECQR